MGGGGIVVVVGRDVEMYVNVGSPCARACVVRRREKVQGEVRGFTIGD